MRSPAVLLAATVAAVVFTAAAVAGQRTSETEVFSDPFSGSFACQGFIATLSGRDHGRVKTWFDADGNPIKQEGHIEATETDVNTSTGKSIDVHTHLQVHVDFVAGTVSITGVRNLSTVPGQGVVVQHVGRAVTDLESGSVISLSGKYPEFAAAYMDDDFCAALA